MENFFGLLRLHEQHRLAQKLENLQTLRYGQFTTIEFFKLAQQAPMGWTDVDQRQRLQPFRARCRTPEFGIGVGRDDGQVEVHV